MIDGSTGMNIPPTFGARGGFGFEIGNLFFPLSQP
jgi:hypothetical protein